MRDRDTANGNAIRVQIEEREIREQDVKDAVAWARSETGVETQEDCEGQCSGQG